MKHFDTAEPSEHKHRRVVPLTPPTELWHAATQDIVEDLNALLLEVLALVEKTRHCHFRLSSLNGLSGVGYHNCLTQLDDQAVELFDMSDILAERIRKIGGRVPPPMADFIEVQSEQVNTVDFVELTYMLTALSDGNQMLATNLLATYDMCKEHSDRATASLLDDWIDEAEDRSWSLMELITSSETTGH